MDGGTWRATAREVAKSWTWLKQLSTHPVDPVVVVQVNTPIRGRKEAWKTRPERQERECLHLETRFREKQESECLWHCGGGDGVCAGQELQRAGHVSSPDFQAVCPLSYLFSQVLSRNGPNLNESSASVSKQFQRISKTVADLVFSPIHCMSQRLEVTWSFQYQGDDLIRLAPEYPA